MITIITDEKQIQKIQKEFIDRLDQFFLEEINCRIGYQGDSAFKTVHYSPELDMWYFTELVENRFWNAFGSGKPKEKVSNFLVVEVNFPLRDINRRISGCFGINEQSTFILHRGKITNKNGITKKYFKDNFRGDSVTAIDGDRETEFFLIGELNSKNFPKQLANFIKEINRMKNLDMVNNK